MRSRMNRPSSAEPGGIRARGLVKRFGRVTALAGLDLDVAAGEVVSVLGPNGAGKSTLLRILGTTLLPDSGSASVAGVDVAADPIAARGKVGLMIGDQRSFYWRVSGRRNLAFFASLQRMRGAEAVARVAETLELVGLADAADRPVRGYSTGMRARLALARALLAGPPVLLLDEPTQSLDPVAAADFRETAAALASDAVSGILLATHDLHEAAAVSDRIVVIAGGRIVLEEDGPGLDPARLETALLDAVGRAPNPIGAPE
jgi:ABC-2 type transport system ATP-binding protein